MHLVERLENWGDAQRWRRRQGQAASFEGAYRSPQGPHWLYGSAPPRTPPAIDARDAAIVNNAWAAMGDAYHQTILGGWYVKRYSEGHCVRLAREAAGDEKTRKRGDFEASLAMAHALIAAQLDLPAVIRRERITLRVQAVLGMDNVTPNGSDKPMRLAVA